MDPQDAISTRTTPARETRMSKVGVPSTSSGRLELTVLHCRLTCTITDQDPTRIAERDNNGRPISQHPSAPAGD